MMGSTNQRGGRTNSTRGTVTNIKLDFLYLHFSLSLLFPFSSPSYSIIHSLTYSTHSQLLGVSTWSKIGRSGFIMLEHWSIACRHRSGVRLLYNRQKSLYSSLQLSGSPGYGIYSRVFSLPHDIPNAEHSLKTTSTQSQAT